MRSDYQIQVEKQTEDDSKFMFVVVVKTKGSETKHSVIVDKDYYQKLSGNEEPPENLVKRSFKFLLEREPQGAILKKFNLSVIQDYFSEYENKIRK